MKVFLTGSTGFVGTTLLQRFVADGIEAVALVRNGSVGLPDGVESVVGDLNSLVVADRLPRRSASRNDGDNVNFCASLELMLENIDVIAHAAARAHIMREAAEDPLAEYRKVNRDATLALARLAAESGVKRFVFLSSIGVHGNSNVKPFTEQDEPAPHDLYAISKLEAEHGLLDIAKETGMEVVIVRPPLVYAPNAPGNFGSLVKWVKKGVPLPFGSIHNQRSLVALDNLVDFIALCADREKSPKAANQIFLISDGEDVSTTQLLKKVAKAFNKKAMLLPIPVGIMTFMAKLLGKGDVANRLFGSLQVDSSKARDLLGWKPVTSMDEQLKKTAQAYISEKK
ncbi:NAD-dependent epimerase/dehydratase family protein [Thiomicrorhabdus sp.]|uniref:NAD-dependent epimerase/dehydratase family protein n=1 Tax=Thiomicrorhabdus sp. TaxID=2039724 RepID=UPI002AA7CB51|nr:NAD-dependent epimerase/dehydratase family protein [Thiomicrorhabdus sp.]